MAQSPGLGTRGFDEDRDAGSESEIPLLYGTTVCIVHLTYGEASMGDGKSAVSAVCSEGLVSRFERPRPRACVVLKNFDPGWKCWRG